MGSRRESLGSIWLISGCGGPNVPYSWMSVLYNSMILSETPGIFDVETKSFLTGASPGRWLKDSVQQCWL